MRKSVLLMVIMLTVGMAAQAQTFAFIDMEYILKAIPAYEQANQQLEEASKKWQSEIESVGQQAQRLYEEYQAKAASLTDKQRGEKENAIIAKEKEANELRLTYFGPEGEMVKLREQLITPIEDKIYQAVKAVAEQKGYSAIIDRASASSVIFASPRIDVSNEVLAKLGYSN